MMLVMIIEMDRNFTKYGRRRARTEEGEGSVGTQKSGLLLMCQVSLIIIMLVMIIAKIIIMWVMMIIIMTIT